jgi:hypothetical protein
MIKRSTLAVDFDGVIHKYSLGWKDGSIYDVPVDGAKESLAKLGEKFNIVIFTTRLNPELGDTANQKMEMLSWLKKYSFTEGIHYHKLSGFKPKAKIYLDDRGMKFVNWEDSIKEILS